MFANLRDDFDLEISVETEISNSYPSLYEICNDKVIQLSKALLARVAWVAGSRSSVGIRWDRLINHGNPFARPAKTNGC